jgi:phage FluMu protein Com
MVWALSELRGLGVADWAAAYGTHRCLGCDKMFLLRIRDRNGQPSVRKACPHCSHLVEEEIYESEAAGI